MAQNDPQWQILPKKWLRLAPNGQFWSFCRFFHLFPQNEAQIDLEWPISPDSQLSPSFATKVSHFWRNLKSLCSSGYISKFFEFLNFFKLFHTREAQNDPQWQILPKKWLRLAQNSQFWSFCRFFHLFPQNQAQIYLEWLITRFTTFPIFYHHSISFLEKSHRFSFLGGYISKFFEFFNFFESFHTKLTQNDPQWQILPPKWLGWAQNGQFWLNFNKNLNISVESWPIFTESSEQALFFSASQNESKECYAMIKTDENLNISAESWLIWQILPKKWLRLAPKWPILVILQVFPSFPPKSGSDWPGMANFTRFTTFPIFYHQSVSFLEKSQKFSFLGEGWNINKCFEFSTFFKSFYIKAPQNDPQWWILPP